MDVASSQKVKKSKKSDKKKKRKRSRSSSSDSSDRNSYKPKKKKSKKSKKKSKHSEKETPIKKKSDDEGQQEDYGIPLELMNTKAKAPESQAEYELRQSVIRKVYDEATGRLRLIKGDGEVIEEIVSKTRHDDINKAATKSDGSTFKKTLGLNKDEPY